MLTAAQHEARARGLGGSDTATILNLNPYKSAYELWQEKSGRVTPEDISNRFPIVRGNDMEALVAKWFTDETGLVVRRDNRSITNDDFPYMVAHIDRRIQGKPEGLECKTANWRVAMKFGEAGTDDVPANYLIQCMHYMIVTGWKVWHLAADLGGDFKIYRIEYDDVLARHIASSVEKWWTDHIINDVEPEPKTAIELDLAYPSADAGVIVEASTEIAGVHSELKTIHSDMKELGNRADALKSQIKAAMGDAAGITYDGKKLASWNNQSRSKFNRKAFEAAYPGIYETYETKSEFRVFRPNFK